MLSQSALLVVLCIFVTHTLGFAKPFIPLDWTTLSSCAIDNPMRIIIDDTTIQAANNTPATCVSTCAAAGFGYAGVEFGDECHCGTGIVDPLLPAPDTDCSIACAGNDTLSCGGSWRIQLYTFPALRPGTWTYQGCVVDTPAAPAFADASLQTPFETTLDAVNQCLQACARAGATFAGIEDGGACQCSGEGVADGAATANESECNSLCPLPGDAGFEFCGGVERLGVYKFAG